MVIFDVLGPLGVVAAITLIGTMLGTGLAFHAHARTGEAHDHADR